VHSQQHASDDLAKDEKPSNPNAALKTNIWKGQHPNTPMMLATNHWLSDNVAQALTGVGRVARTAG
jgi:hypothetical protein